MYFSTEYAPVKTKRDFAIRYARGEFGNASPTWRSLDEFLTDSTIGDDDNRYHLRNARIPGGDTYYDLTRSELVAAWATQKDGWYCSAMAPTDKTLIQGEVMQRDNGAGLYLFYSTVRLPMREALRVRSASAAGIIAVSLLRYYLCPASMDWLETLLGRYPEHVIEFSAYDRPWGTLVPKYNTVFWEVRSY